MKNQSKNEKKGNLLVKLSGVSGITALFLLAAIILFSVISVRSVRSTSMETALMMGRDKLTGYMFYFENMIFNEYGLLSLQDGKLSGQDSVSMEYQYEIVDRINAALGIVATVFISDGDDFRRISTSIVDESGNRAIDTYLGTNSAAYPAVHSGEDYSGTAVILGRDYLTYYRPIFAPDSKTVIGTLFIGTEMTKILQVISKNTSDHVNQIFIIALIILLTLIVVNTMSINMVLVKPIRAVTAIISRLSTGDINQQIEESKSRDEVGTMKNELKQLIDGLKDTANFAQNIGKGNLHAEYQPLSEKDVLGNSLLEMRQSLQNAEKTQAMHAEIEKHRNWATSGLAKFAEILRKDNNNLETLSYNIISNLVKYLDASQGGIFIVNDADSAEEAFLEMKACYAFDRKKFVEKQIRPGEGLIGTCYLEGEPIYMTELPDHYISITSGLGEANPKSVLICPLKVNDDIYGVIELASFNEFEPYQLEFVQKLCESIASTISAVKVNIRTGKLLEQTKLQAEEMANAEEELRQNMEEMQATQEEMRRRENDLQDSMVKMKEAQVTAEIKEHEMQQFYNAFSDSCHLIIYSSEGVITDVNDKLLKLFNIPDKSVWVGLRMTDFLGEETSRKVMEQLAQGKSYEECQAIDTGAGEKINFRQKFTPICDSQGKPLWILLITTPEQN